ncbi:MAG: type I secretion system permease/ATPase [Stappiaceae bacterium]
MPNLTPDQILEILRIIHILGISIGLGGAIVADLLGLRLLLSARPKPIEGALGQIHHTVLLGLAIIWASGLAIAYIKVPLDAIPNKVFLKLTVVSLLTINGFFIGRYLVPLAEKRAKPLLATFSLSEVCTSALFMSISISCWFAALFVSKSTDLQQMPLSTMFTMAYFFWCSICIAVLLFLFVGKVILTSVGKHGAPLDPEPRGGFRPGLSPVGSSAGFRINPIPSSPAMAGVSAFADNQANENNLSADGARAKYQSLKDRFAGQSQAEAPTSAFGGMRAANDMPDRSEALHLRSKFDRSTNGKNKSQPAEFPTGKLMGFFKRLGSGNSTKVDQRELPQSSGRRLWGQPSDARPQAHTHDKISTDNAGQETVQNTALSNKLPVMREDAGTVANRQQPKQATAGKKQEFDRARVTGSLFRMCRGAIMGTVGISFIVNVLMLTGPLFMLQIYDRVLTSGSVPTLMALIGLVTGLFFFMGLLELVRSRIMVRLGLRIDRTLSGPVFASIMSVTSGGAAAVKNRLLQDLTQIRQFVAGPGPTAMFDIPWTPLYFALIFAFHWILGVTALAGAAVLIVLSLINDRFSREPVEEASKRSSQANAMAEAGRKNAEVLHSMGMINVFRDRWLQEHGAGISAYRKASDISGTLTTITKITRLFLQSLILAVGAYLAILQEITPGVIIATSIIMSRGLAPVEQLIGQWRGLLSTRQGLARIQTELAEDADTPDFMTLPEPRAYVQVEKIFAAAPGSRQPVLKGVEFSMGPGDAVAVVGQSGSGKSTLARALVGVWPTIKGHVRLDGAALDQWDPEQLGRNVGYLPQDVELFDGSIAENIARFEGNADPGAIVAAARKAQVHELILQLPDGYGTRVGEGGTTLSGGQRQRIGLARALYGKPVLVVLDEPNSNLDTEGEKALGQAIGTLREEGSAVIVMAHRSNIVNFVNLVLVIKDGRVVTFGDKDDVLGRRTNVPSGKKLRKANVQAVAHNPTE